jgi:autotransporter-associated beta strand protein
VLSSPNGAGSTVILTGNNSYPGTTIVDAGQTLQVGNGGTAGSIGSGAITDNGILIFDRSDAITYGSAISGTGILVKASSGTMTLTGANTLTGDTTVSNGTLVLVGTNSNFGANLNIDGGKLVVGGVGLLSSNTVYNYMNINAGVITIAINESLTQSNTLFVAGGVNYNGGTLQLINYGPALHVGDKFAIFSSAVASSVGPVVLSTPGFTVNNNLTGDGTVTVTGILPAPAITTSVTGGNQLNLSWPSAYAGYLLQAQTNTVAKGLVTTNWITIPGTDAGSTYTATINKTNGVVFYRLAP